MQCILKSLTKVRPASLSRYKLLITSNPPCACSDYAIMNPDNPKQFGVSAPELSHAVRCVLILTHVWGLWVHNFDSILVWIT